MFGCERSIGCYVVALMVANLLASQGGVCTETRRACAVVEERRTVHYFQHSLRQREGCCSNRSSSFLAEL